MQKLTITLLLASAMFLLPTDRAQAAGGVRQVGNVGIGLGAGTLATGFSVKYHMDPKMSRQGNVGLWRSGWYCNRFRCWGGGQSLAASGDLIFEMPVLTGNKDVTLAWEVGGGVGLGLSEYGNHVGFAINGVVGLQVNIDVVPLDVVLEYRPGIYLAPGFGFDLVNGGAHIRYYF